MAMGIVNLGILAHVDAGKTSLTERILFETGVIRTIGSVDKGTTQTDTLELERQRGITIKSAVASFRLAGLDVNLIDTPGHGDFIAEVARSLAALDAVVLVVSAVEGVQSQTRRLTRAIRAAGLPLIVFVNKIDRLGARGEPLLADLHAKLGLRVVPLTVPHGLGERTATVAPLERSSPGWRDPLLNLLAETSERAIEEFERTSGEVSDDWLADELRRQVAAGDIVPVFFGSAITGAGVPELLGGVVEWLPRAAQEDDAPASGRVFKITRRPSGEKLVYLRLDSGCLSVRQRVELWRRDAFGEPLRIEERITAIERFSGGALVAADGVCAGGIAVLHGLRAARIGDRIGVEETARTLADAFPPPALESVVHPLDPARVTRLREALEQLAEQDPLIALRQRNAAGEISVRLYGEVQKEVLTDTLLRDFGVRVAFGPSRTICIERLLDSGEALEDIAAPDNPFEATVGVRVSPAPPGSGIRYQRELGALPLAFYRAIEETVYESLQQGLHGWEIADGTVEITRVGMCPITTAGDFRKLTPLALLEAIRRAGTVVCEPFDELEIDIPEDTFGAVCGALVSARATIRDTRTLAPGTQRLLCELPAAELRAIEQQLPGLTHGEGSWVSQFARYVPIPGDPPVRARIGPNPLVRAQYLADVARG